MRVHQFNLPQTIFLFSNFSPIHGYHCDIIALKKKLKRFLTFIDVFSCYRKFCFFGFPEKLGVVSKINFQIWKENVKTHKISYKNFFVIILFEEIDVKRCGIFKDGCKNIFDFQKLLWSNKNDPFERSKYCNYIL